MYGIEAKEETKMYLGLLNAREKELFLGLAQHLIWVDGENSKEEQQMLLNYCEEMNLPYINEPVQATDEEIIAELIQMSTIQSKKIIIFELLGLALVDGHYDKKEKEMLRVMNEHFGIGDDFGIRCEELIRSYIKLQKEIEEVVLK